MAQEKSEGSGQLGSEAAGEEAEGQNGEGEETLDAKDVLFALCYQAHQEGEQKFRITYDGLEEALSSAGLLDIWDEALEAVEGEDEDDEEDGEDDSEGDVDDDEE